MPYDIIAIMTVYHPTPIHVRNARRIMEQVDWLFVFDNSPSDSAVLFADLERCSYSCHKENIGLSCAFNYVLKTFSKCIAEDAAVLFFDQDTVIPENHITKLHGVFNELRKIGEPVGAIGPVYIDVSDGEARFPKHGKWITKESMRVRTLITSSMLCQYGTLKEIDFWNEKIFLDMADWDLCWRLRRHGYSCCMTQASLIRHTVGEGRQGKGGASIIIWKPFRIYYQTRDLLRLCGESYVPFLEKVHVSLTFLMRYIYQLAFLDHKYARLRYLFYGIRDYFSQYTGVIKY